MDKFVKTNPKDLEAEPIDDDDGFSAYELKPQFTRYS